MSTLDSPPPAPSRRPIPLPTVVSTDVSPASSSPSLYSHPLSHVGHSPRHIMNPYRALRVVSEPDLSSEDEVDKRLSMVSGPKVRKFGKEAPWDEDMWGQLTASNELGLTGLGRNANRIARTAARSAMGSRSRTVSPSVSMAESNGSTTLGLSQLLGIQHTTFGGKHLLASASGASLASDRTASTASDLTANPVTPKLRAAFDAFESPASPIPAHKSVYDNVIPRVLRGFGDPGEPARLNVSIRPGMREHKEHHRMESSTLLCVNTPQMASLFVAPDRPLKSSGSPTFGLISLEAAQERERLRSTRPSTIHHSKAHSMVQSDIPVKNHVRGHTEPASTTHPNRTPTLAPSKFPQPPLNRSLPPAPVDLPTPTVTASATSPPPHPRIRGKKSGLMKFLNKAHASVTSTTASNPSACTGTYPVKTRIGDPMPVPANRPRLERGDSTESHVTSHPASMWSSSEGEAVWSARSELDSNRTTLSTGTKPTLELRPVSMTFTRALPPSYLSHKDHPPDASPLAEHGLPDIHPGGKKAEDLVLLLKDQIANARKAWRVQLYELEAQLREVKLELEDAKGSKKARMGRGACDACGCLCGGAPARKGGIAGTGAGSGAAGGAGGVMDRARVKTAGARGVFGSGSLYEWE